MAWLLAGLPLLLAGRFTPVLTLAVSVPLAGVLIYLGLRWFGRGRALGGRGRRTRPGGRSPGWSRWRPRSAPTS